jgi:hypothetical protein
MRLNHGHPLAIMNDRARTLSHLSQSIYVAPEAVSLPRTIEQHDPDLRQIQ